MITINEFYKIILDIYLLSGTNPSFEPDELQARMMLIYNKLKDKNYEREDFFNLVNDEELLGSRIKYLSIKKALDRIASERLEKEHLKQKKKEEEETKRFWKANFCYIQEGICDRNCYQCPVQLCDLIANESIRAIREILTGEKTVEEANRELALKFKGVGFEEKIPELQPF